jgi:hypothetical protein
LKKRVNNSEDGDKILENILRSRYPKDPPRVIRKLAEAYKMKVEQILSSPGGQLVEAAALKIDRNQKMIGELKSPT